MQVLATSVLTLRCSIVARLCCHVVCMCARAFALSCSIPFDPAPRDETFNEKKRVPDYFM